MNNLIEIIIKAITKDAETRIKATESNLTKLGKSARQVGKDIRTFALTVGIAAGILYLLGRAIEGVADRAEALGDSRLTKSIDKLKQSFQQFLDQIITTTLPGGGTILDALNQGAQNLIPVVRALGVVVEMAMGGFRDMVIAIQRLQGVLDQAQGKSTKYTKEWMQFALVQNHVNTNLRIGKIWTGQLTEEIVKQNQALYGLGKNAKGAGNAIKMQSQAVQKLKSDFEGLKAAMDKVYERENAIRTGDARALAELNRGSSGGGIFGRAAQMTGGNQGTPAHGGGAKGGMNVTILADFGDGPIKGTVRQVIADEVMGGGGKKK